MRIYVSIVVYIFIAFFSFIQGQNTAERLYNQAEAFASEHKLQESNDRYTDALKVYEQEENWAQYYQCRYAIVYNYLNQYKFDKARTEVEAAINHFEERYIDTFIIQQPRLYHAAGQVYKDLHQYDKAIVNNRLAMKYYQLVPDSISRVKFSSYMFNNIGSVYKVKRSMDSALYYFELALPLKVKSLGPTANSTLRTIKSISAIYQDWGQLDRAIKTQNIALEGAIESGNRNAEAQAYNGLSQMYQRKKDFETSKLYISKSMEIYRQISQNSPEYEINLAHSYHQMGNVLEGERSHIESIQWYTTAKNMYRKVHNGKLSYQEGNSTMNLGKAYNYMAQKLEDSSMEIDARNPEVRALRKRAIEFYEENERIFTASVSKDHARWIELWLSKGVCLVEHLDTVGAHNLFSKAYERAYKVAPEKSYDRSLACLNLARTTTDVKSALALYQQGLWELSNEWEPESLDDNPTAKEVFYEDWSVHIMIEKAKRMQQLAGLQNDLSLLKTGILSINAADDLLDESRASFLTTSAKINLGSLGHKVYSRGIELCYLMKEQEEQAFRYIEKNKSLVLLEALHSGKRIHDIMIPDSLSSKLQRLSAKIAERTSYQNQFVNSDKYSDIGAEIFDLEQKRNHVKKIIENQFPITKRIGDQGQILTITQVQSKLSENEVIYEYSLTEEDLYILKIEKKRSKLYKAKNIDFQQELDALLDIISDEDLAINKSNSPDIWEAYQQYANHLFHQLLPDYNNENLLIIPDGKLNYLPFELLLTEPKNTDQINYSTLPYLLKLATIKYAFSTTLHFAVMDGKNEDLKGLLAFAPTYPPTPAGMLASRAGFTSLAHTLSEATTISEMMNGDRFLGKNATVEQFKASAGNYNMLHLAMHAFTHDKDPMLSGMVFTETETDNILHAHELYNMNIPSNLVVLSACNTGLGQFSEGEGVMSLGRAFRHDGTKNVIISLLQANDASTSQVMKSFYKNLTNGIPKAQALRRAKLDYLESGANVFPFFWSSFVLLGDDKPIALQKGYGKWITGIITILFLAVLFFGIIQKKHNSESK